MNKESIKLKFDIKKQTTNKAKNIVKIILRCYVIYDIFTKKVGL